ncbi:hypothetical protein QHH11_13560, partial [Aphanizomenon sp. PH219]|nr:hypothetical protein [Aphanizomenon sp. PH219]
MKVLDFQELEIYLTPFTPFPFVKGGNNKNLVVCQPENDGCRGIPFSRPRNRRRIMENPEY